MHEPALWAVLQIVENGFIRFDHYSLKRKDLQRPDWICGTLTATVQHTRPVQISDMHKGGALFFVFIDRSQIRSGSALLVSADFLPVSHVTSLFRAETTSCSLLTQAVDRLPVGSRISTASGGQTGAQPECS